MRIGFLTKFLLSMVVLVLLALVAISYRAIDIFDQDKELSVFDRNGQIASNIATEAHTVFREVQRKATIFAGIYLDRRLPARQKRRLLNTIFDQYGEFVRIQIHQPRRRDPESVYNLAAIRRGGFTDKQEYDQAREEVSISLDNVRAGATVLANTTTTTDLPVITVAFPLGERGGSRRPVVVADVSPENLFQLFRASELGVAYLVDGQGRLLAHPDVVKMVDRGEDLSGLPVVARAMEAVAQGQQLEHETMTFEDGEGQVHLAAFAPVGFGGASVITQTPRATAFAAARRLVLQSWWVPVAIFAVAVLLSVIIARRVTQPVTRLSRATEKIGRGDFNVRVDLKSRDELGELAQAFNRMGDELVEREETLEETRKALVQSEKMAAFGQIGAGIAHEVKNPLASILGYAQLAQRKARSNPDGVVKYLGIIEKETKRCKEIIENLMKFARQEKAAFSSINVQDVVDEAIRLVDHQLSINGVKLVQDFQASRTHIMGNANQIEQVLLNLMVNAQHAMEGKEQRTLTVATKEVQLSGNPAVQIRISDTGNGIPPDVLPNIFEPFYTTKPAGKGTGLGLSVSYGLIQDHKGEIRAESELEKGTTFIITLPLAQHQEVAETEGAVAQA